MSKKSLARTESKKRKAAAFLELVKDDSSSQNTKILKQSEDKSKKAESSSLVYGETKTKSLSDQMFEEYKKIMRERQKASMQRPKLFMTLDELAQDDPLQTDPEEVKVPPPLFMADVQHLLLYALQGMQASIKPRWCRLLRYGKITKVVTVVLDDLSLDEFNKYPESLPTLTQAFDIKTELISPVQYGSSVREDIMNVPISMSQIKKQTNKGQNKGSLDIKLKRKPPTRSDYQRWTVVKELNTIMNDPLNSPSTGVKRKLNDSPNEDSNFKKRRQGGTVKSEGEGTYETVSTYKLDKYDRQWLMLNGAQMLYESIPTPVDIYPFSAKYRDFVFTKHEYTKVSSKSPMFALDCEMVQTKASRMDLARVSIVDEKLETVLDMFVKPRAPVINYVTQFSGITKELLDPIETRVEDIQHIIQANLPSDAILVGHSICSDLASMKLFHPYVIDTSVIYNLSGKRRIKTGLKRLTSMFLKRDIQDDILSGHSSVEDAQATMELALLKLRNSMEFGDILMSGICLDELDDNVEQSTSVDNNDTEDMKKENVTESTENARQSSSVDNKDSGGKVKDDEVTETNNVNTDSVKEEKTSPSKCDVRSGDDKSDTNKNCDSKSPSKSADSDNESENSSLTKTLETASNVGANVKRRRLFFHKEAGKFIENFVVRIEKQKRQGYVIDNEDSAKLYPKTLPVIVSENDKQSEKLTLHHMKDGSFCFTHLYGYSKHLSEQSDNLDEEKTKKVLWNLDRRFWKIMMGLPPCSLFVVILPGRNHGTSIHSAMTFAKIT
ncbi:exonuclease [Mactra antiquata]